MTTTRAREESRAPSEMTDDQAFASFYRWRMTMEGESAARSLREEMSVEDYVKVMFGSEAR